MESSHVTQTHNEWVVYVMRARIKYAGMCYRYALRWPSPTAWASWARSMRACHDWKRTAIPRLMARDFS